MTKSAPTKPTMYCLKCWYVLDGLSENRCPECGQAFDPVQPRTYRTRPRGRWWIRLVWRTTAVVLGLMLLASAIVGGWLYLQIRIEQRVIAKIAAVGGRYTTDPGGGAPWDHSPRMLETVVGVDVGYRLITDSWLAHLKELKNLSELDLSGTQVTDAGLAHLKDLKNLTELDLSGTQVTDAGLAHLKELNDLFELDLSGTQVTDAGIAHLKELNDLFELDLSGTQVTDAGLVHLKESNSLGRLDLSGTQVTDAGLAHLKELTDFIGAGRSVAMMRTLHLRNTQVTDAGLAHLKDLSNLWMLDLRGTQVTDAGITDFKRALPNVIFWSDTRRAPP